MKQISDVWRTRPPSTGFGRFRAALGLAAMVVISACASGTSNTTSTGPQASGDSVTVLLPADASGPLKDPDFAKAYGLTFNYSVFDRLWKFDPNGKIIPNVAMKHVVSPDGLSYTITIRSGIQFQDGTPLTADDVKFSIDRARGADPTFKNPEPAGRLVNIASIDVTGPTTVVVHIKAADETLIAELASSDGTVFPKAQLQRLGTTEFWKKPIGSGAYKFDSEVVGQYIKMVADPNYWGSPKASIKNVTLKFVPDGATRLTMLESGDADFAYSIDVSQMSTVTGAGLKVVSTPSGSNMFVQFDPKKAKLSDPRVGQALNMAVDRASILKNIFKGQGFLTTSVDPSVSFIDPNLKPYPYDPAKAKQLLTDAGFDFNARLDMWIPIGYIPGSDSVAQAMASDYQKIGIKLNLISADFATWRTKYLAHTTGDALIMTTNPNYTYDPMYAYSGWVSCASKISYVCDPKLESLIENIRPLAGQARVAAAHDFDKYLYDNPIGVYLMQWNQINATKSNLVVNQPRGFIYMSAADLSIKK